jgi:hypothetical protein
MISATEFNLLNYYEQTEFVLKGIFLAERLTDIFYIRLYALHDFYIEIYFDDSSHLITHFKAFEHTEYVLPYLEELKIAV